MGSILLAAILLAIVVFVVVSFRDKLKKVANALPSLTDFTDIEVEFDGGNPQTEAIAREIQALLMQHGSNPTLSIMKRLDSQEENGHSDELGEVPLRHHVKVVVKQ